MSNPTPSRTAANARSQELLTEAIAKAGAWLDRVIIPGATTTRRDILNADAWGNYIKLFSKEYAALTSIHVRTAKRHLTAALNGRKE